MKTSASSLVILFLLAGFCIVDGKTSDTPIVVSPGSDTGLATVSQTCPTFSWSAVEQASSYWIAVFQSPDATVRSYTDIAVIASPVIVKEIAGPALSWTLPAEERLQNGALYAWYVQAVDSVGNRLGSCSTARVFKVEQEAAWAGMDGKMEEVLRAHGVGEDIIADTMKELKPSKADVSVRSAPSQKPLKGIVNGTAGVTNAIAGQHAGTEGSNTFYGLGAGTFITSGTSDTFIGLYAGWVNTSGSGNTFIGPYAGSNNDTGNYNTFIGRSAGQTNTGQFNTFLGADAGFSNTTASYNTFLGNNSGFSNTTGTSNVFIGDNAGYINSTGTSNVFIGNIAGRNNTTGNNNTFLGNTAGYYNTMGDFNTFLGKDAGFSNSTGSNNTSIGTNAGYSNTEGDFNTFLGNKAGYSNTTGLNNTYLGDYAGYSNTTGSGNTFIGNEVGALETGSNKLYIDNSSTSDPLIYGDFDTNIVNINGKLGIGTRTPGYPLEIVTTGAKASIVVGRPDGAKNWMNATTAFGNFGTVNNYPLRLQVNSVARMTLYNDNSLMMANTARLTAGGVWTDASSIALKENIFALDSDEAATTLQALNPVKYNYKADKNENHVGFIAEEVPEMVAMKDRKSLSPMDIVAVLTKVTQDQQNQLQEQQKTIANLTQKMLEQQQNHDKIKMEIAELKMKQPE